MLEELRANKIPINQISIDPHRMFSPRVKMEAYLAQSQELKDSAQRAFLAYLKSVYLTKNKKIFNVESINFDEYAKSLGLAVTPRVRFLQRLKKRKEIEQKRINGEDVDSNESASEESDNDGHDAKDIKKLKSIDLSALMADDDSDDDDAGLVQLKRKDHDIEENDHENVIEDIQAARKEKLITKAALAKKIIKKKIIPNNKIQFDEDGNAKINTAKQLQSELAKEYEEADEGGIDIEKAKKLLREEDKFDRKRFKELVKLKHRETKKKLKKKKKVEEKDEEGEDEVGDDFESGDEPDISWLPDYDKINGTSNENNDDSDDAYNFNDDEENDSDESSIHKLPAKLYEKHRANSESDDENEEERPKKKKSRRDIASKFDLNDAEALAMSLLNK